MLVNRGTSQTAFWFASVSRGQGRSKDPLSGTGGHEGESVCPKQPKCSVSMKHTIILWNILDGTNPTRRLHPRLASDSSSSWRMWASLASGVRGGSGKACDSSRLVGLSGALGPLQCLLGGIVCFTRNGDASAEHDMHHHERAVRCD